MEKGPDTSIGFSVSDKKSSSNSDFVSSMMGTRRLDRLFGGDDVEDGGGSTGGGVVGPTNNSGGANEVEGNIYRDDVISASSSRGGENLVPKGTNLQPFDIFPPSSNHTIPNKSPAGTMAAALEFPFTSAQWKELERQAMIYKYMISSVPVPSHLLFPLSRDFPAPTLDSSASLYSGRYSKKGDPEPGRCKRTDGKKWRCSRDVAPHQKYCERHLHRGRPRSRKPVEVKSNAENHKKQTTRSLPSLHQSASASASSQQHFVASQNEPFLLFNDKTDLSICTPSYKETNRDLRLMMENEIVSRDPWQHWMEPNIGLANEGFSVYTSNGPMFHQDYVEHQQLNSFPYPNFAAPEIELPNGFIDAWSIDNMNRANNVNVQSSISLNDGDLSPSLNLTMAMAAGDILDKEMLSIEMGNSSVSWEPFARGGPLGEALQPIGDSNPPSPYNSISTPATTVSSPSGVLHRALFSHSDGSVCNSPIRF